MLKRLFIFSFLSILLASPMAQAMSCQDILDAAAQVVHRPEDFDRYKTDTDAFLQAARKNDLAEMKRLVSLANTQILPTAADESGETALMIAIHLENLEMIDFLFSDEVTKLTLFHLHPVFVEFQSMGLALGMSPRLLSGSLEIRAKRILLTKNLKGIAVDRLAESTKNPQVMEKIKSLAKALGIAFS